MWRKSGTILAEAAKQYKVNGITEHQMMSDEYRIDRDNEKRTKEANIRVYREYKCEENG